MLDNAEDRVYVGSYTGEHFSGRGIALATLDATGRPIVSEEVVAETPDPSFLAMAPHAPLLYAVNEVTDGRVTAFAVESDGSLSELNSQPTLGSAPCHLSVHPSGKYLLTANYVSGNLAVHPIDKGGVLREPCHAVQHSGGGPNRQRQLGPHAHQVLPDPSGSHVLAVDLGTDSIYVYDFDERSGHMVIREQAVLPPGSGPRHLVFHPSGGRGYVINELASTVTEFGYDDRSGAIELGETLSTIPGDFEGENLASEVVVTPDGRFVLGSNRGHDSIAVFSAESGDFRRLGVHPAGVGEPRHISMVHDGKVLLVGGQNSSTVQAFSISDTGELASAGEPTTVPCPACLLPARV